MTKMTMSTDVLSIGSIHDYSDTERNSQSQSPLRRSGHTQKSREKNTVPEDVQEEIEGLLENVPDLTSTFNILDKIGAGTFSSVYVAELKNCPHIDKKFALKHIIPTSHPSRIENELRCLQEIGGCDNVMGVEACLRARDHVVIVMPYFPHDPFQDYIKSVTLEDVREYMKAMFVALRRVHAVDIIHRDVKPTNFLVNKKLHRYALVDFGLAQKAPVPLKQGSGSGKVVHLAKVPSSSQGKPTVSPKKSRRTCTEVRTSPRKRKLRGDDGENYPESPRKRRNDADKERKLSVVDMNASKIDLKTPGDQEDMKHGEEEKKVSLAPLGSGEMFNAGYNNRSKSPRRMLLTKRALDLGRGGSAPAKPTLQPRTVVVQQAGKPMFKTVTAMPACQCFGQPMICSICLSRSPQAAPRAGTPGFRAPEVLMKCPNQTTAVDIWSAGVIFLSLLAGRYPFFKADDDMTALAQIVSIIGTAEMKAAAKTYGKDLICSPTLPAVNLRVLCEKLRGTSRTSRTKSSSSSPNNESILSDVPDSAYELLRNLLNPNPSERITAEEALSHPFIS